MTDKLGSPQGWREFYALASLARRTTVVLETQMTEEERTCARLTCGGETARPTAMHAVLL